MEGIPKIRRSAVKDWSAEQTLWDGLALAVGAGTSALDTGAVAAELPTIEPCQPKARTGNTAQCRVPGCTADLMSDLSYFRKYRVCREHLKCPVILVEGAPSRFCQQCSRFHHVGAFDGTQRTCREMLVRLRQKRQVNKQRTGTSSGSTSSGKSGGGDDGPDKRAATGSRKYTANQASAQARKGRSGRAEGSPGGSDQTDNGLPAVDRQPQQQQGSLLGSLLHAAPGRSSLQQFRGASQPGDVSTVGTNGQSQQQQLLGEQASGVVGLTGLSLPASVQAMLASHAATSGSGSGSGTELSWIPASVWTATTQQQLPNNTQGSLLNSNAAFSRMSHQQLQLQLLQEQRALEEQRLRLLGVLPDQLRLANEPVMDEAELHGLQAQGLQSALDAAAAQVQANGGTWLPLDVALQQQQQHHQQRRQGMGQQRLLAVMPRPATTQPQGLAGLDMSGPAFASDMHQPVDLLNRSSSRFRQLSASSTFDHPSLSATDVRGASGAKGTNGGLGLGLLGSVGVGGSGDVHRSFNATQALAEHLQHAGPLLTANPLECLSQVRFTAGALGLAADGSGSAMATMIGQSSSAHTQTSSGMATDDTDVQVQPMRMRGHALGSMSGTVGTDSLPSAYLGAGQAAPLDLSLPRASSSAATTVTMTMGSDNALAAMMMQSVGATEYDLYNGALLERLSIKLHNALPSDLPRHLLQRLQVFLKQTPAEVLQGYLRPGCTHLLVDLWLPSKVAVSEVSDAVTLRARLETAERTFQQLLGDVAASDIDVRCGHQTLSLQAGKPPRRLDAAQTSTGGASSAPSAVPVPVLVSLSAAAAATGADTTMVLRGTCLSEGSGKAYVRCRGRHFPIILQHTAKVAPTDDDALTLESATRPGGFRQAMASLATLTETEVVLPRTAHPGLVMLEWETADGDLSNWLPLVVAPSAQSAMEINVLLRGGAQGAGHKLRPFLVGMGLLLDYHTRIQQGDFPDPEVNEISRTPSANLVSALCDEHCDDTDGTDGRNAAAAAAAAAAGGTADGQSDEDDGAGGSSDADKPMPPPLLYASHRARIRQLAPSVLAFAADNGMASTMSWVADFTLRYVTGGDYAALLSSVEAVSGGGGLTLLHRAARGGSAQAVGTLAAMAAARGAWLNFGCRAGQFSSTPLHYAALQPCNLSLLQACLAAGPEVPLLWTSAKDNAGYTAQDYAVKQSERLGASGSASAGPSSRVSLGSKHPAEYAQFFKPHGSTASSEYNSWGSELEVASSGAGSGEVPAGVSRSLAGQMVAVAPSGGVAVVQQPSAPPPFFAFAPMAVKPQQGHDQAAPGAGAAAVDAEQATSAPVVTAGLCLQDSADDFRERLTHPGVAERPRHAGGVDAVVGSAASSTNITDVRTTAGAILSSAVTSSCCGSGPSTTGLFDSGSAAGGERARLLRSSLRQSLVGWRSSSTSSGDQSSSAAVGSPSSGSGEPAAGEHGASGCCHSKAAAKAFLGDSSEDLAPATAGTAAACFESDDLASLLPALWPVDVPPEAARHDAAAGAAAAPAHRTSTAAPGIAIIKRHGMPLAAALIAAFAVVLALLLARARASGGNGLHA